MQFYHGSNKGYLHYFPWDGESDEMDMLFASADASVAQRYGKNVFSVKLDLPLESVPRISVRDWMLGEEIPKGTFIIEAEEGNDDFPVETLVMRYTLDATIDPKPIHSAEEASA